MSTPACPDADVLLRFTLGQLAPEQVDSLARHVDDCDGCANTLHGLASEDTLIEAMASQASLGEIRADECVSALIKRFKTLPRSDAKDSSEPTMGTAIENTPAPAAAGPAAEQTQEQFTFLSPAEAPGELGRLGGYQVLSLLGTGGMGLVFRALDPGLKRIIALKVMKPELSARPDFSARFQREAEASAAVKHDYIATVYHVGQDQGTAFLAMELLEGESLAARLDREGKLPVAEVLRIGYQAACGLAAAHARGLIHRDIKPANLWLEGEPGASATGGRVKILDFGLAKLERSDVQATQSGRVMGTPSYMAPEQARGEMVDGRADLFSLGCVLYRAATGKNPFKGGETLSVLWSLANERPERVRAVNPDVPAAMSDLIDRLLTKDAASRPSSARAVAEALEAISQQQAGPARARTPRRRVAIAVAAGLAAAVIGMIVVIIRDPHGREVARIDVPKGGSVEIQDGDKGQDKGQKQQAPKEGVPIQPMALAPLLPGEPLAPTALVQEPIRLAGVRSWTIAPRNGDIPMVLAYRPDGKRLAVGSGDANIRIWDPQTGQLVQVLLGPRSISALAWSPDGRTLAVGSYEEKRLIRLWDTDSGLLLRTMEAPTQGIDVLAWSPDGRSIVACGRNPWHCLTWNATDGKVLRDVPLPAWPARLSPDGKRVAGLGRDGKIAVWDAETGKEMRSLDGPARPLTFNFAWSPDGKRLAAAEPTCLQVWDVESGKEDFKHAQALFGYAASPFIAWSPDGRTLAYNLTGNQGVETIELKAGAKPRRLEDAGGSILAWSPDGKTIARGNQHISNRVALYDALTGKRLRLLSEATLPGAVACSPDGRTLGVYEVAKAAITLSSVDNGELITVFKDTASPLAWSPDGKTLALHAFAKGDILLHEPGGKLRHVLRGWATELAWSPDGKVLASSSWLEKRVLLWDAGKGEQLKEVGPLPERAQHLSWSPDGRLLAFEVPQIGWHIWDVQKNKLTNDPKEWKVSALLFRPTAQSAQVLVKQGVVFHHLKELDTGKELGQLSHAAGVHSMPAWAPDGRVLAVPVAKTVELWRGDLKRRLRTLGAAARPNVSQVGFSQDGALVLGLAADRLHVWEADTGRLGGVRLLGGCHNGLTIAANGLYAGNDQVESSMVMVVQKEDGTQEVLEPADFEQKYGFKNRPDKVHLLEPLPPSMTVPEGQPMGPLALVREPASLPDACSWTIETRSARAQVRAVAYRPDGKLLATGGDDGTIRLWDTASGELVRMLVGDSVWSLSWSPDGKVLAVSGGAGDPRLWEVDTGRLLRRLPAGSVVAWSPRSSTLAIAKAGQLRLWDAVGNKTVLTYDFPAAIHALAWSHDGKAIAVGLTDKTARLWDVATAKETKTLAGHHGDYVNGLAWAPDGKRLATTAQVGGKRDPAFRVWDAVSGKLLGRFERQCTDSTPAIGWSPDGTAIALGLYQGEHGLFDPQTGKMLRSFQASQFVSALAMSPDGKQVALAGDFGVRLRSASTGKVVHALEGLNPMQSIQSIAWSPDGRALALGYRVHDQDSLRVVAVATGQRMPPRLTDAWAAAAWSPDGKTLAAIAGDQSVCLWDVASNKLVRTLEGKTKAMALAWSADGKVLAATSGQKLWVWSADTGKLLWQNDKHQVWGLAWSPDSSRLATGDHSETGAVRLWETVTGKLLHEVPCQSWELAWSPDSKLLVAGPPGVGKCFVIDATSGAVLAKTLADVGFLRCLRWSADGKTFATFQSAGRLELWDAATGEHRRFVELCQLPGGVYPAVWSRDGRVLARGNGFEIHLSDADGLPLGVLLPGEPFQQLTITADGQYRGTARVDREIMVVVQRRDGSSETLTPAVFEHSYGWHNDPAKVRLIE
jgi:WD40 repeat protein